MGWISWVLLVVVLVVVERGLGPVSGFGCTRSFFGVHLGCFCVFQQFLQYRVNTYYKRKVIQRRPRLFVMFWTVWVLGGEFLG